MNSLPLGKLPPALLDKLLSKIPILDQNVVLGPGTGIDCSVIDIGSQYLVIKSDPISLTSENIGWYAVEINTNDIVTTGADPKWMMATLLLPENDTTAEQVEIILDQLIDATRKYDITLIGGHTEITNGVNRPILASTMLGLVDKNKLITPKGINSGDIIFLTKEVAIEAVSILANDFSNKLKGVLSFEEIERAKSYIINPGISIYKEATLLRGGFGITGMHDPTEGGISAALWEMSTASGKILQIDLENIPVSNLARKICDHFSINPINSISSGALLFTAQPEYKERIMKLLNDNSIHISEIGVVLDNGVRVESHDQKGKTLLPHPQQDEITKVF
ncbi:MAG TPA: AIR synthase family protein [Anaerolineaceae bacterium]|nr:AIR synthase family protein [Anaerolineaceae bacterium]